MRPPSWEAVLALLTPAAWAAYQMRAFIRRLSLVTRQFSTSSIAMTYPSKIHAITIAKNGGPEVIEKTEIPSPTVEPGHVVVKVTSSLVIQPARSLPYSALDPPHWSCREGVYPVAKFPFVLGKEAAGVIVRLPTDAGVLNDSDYQKRGYREGACVAVDTSGAHAEYISIPWKTVYPVPDTISTRTAVSALLQGLTAISFMEEAYNVQKGDIILIHTVAGGLGLLFSQLAKSRGATVIGTTSTEEKAAIAKQNGADHVIIYKKENTVQRVLEITNGEGVHAVFDGVGKDTFDSNFEMLRRKGTLVSVGNASGPVPPFAPLRLVQKNLKLLRPTVGNYTYTASEVLYYSNKLWSLVESGTLRPIIHEEYPFTAEGVKQAQTDLTGGKTVGKLVIKVSE
ncbi:hypothetical protein J3R83DRAFT_6131 [Lanmaoa asiatica]|nr:hypothetical protein J3R83DRAFT_6131 [Lanmaoa asiatica]